MQEPLFTGERGSKRKSGRRETWMKRYWIDEEELLSLLREGVRTSPGGAKAADRLPRRLINQAARTNGCNWSLAELDDLPPAVAQVLRGHAARLQRIYNVRKSGAVDDQQAS